MLKRARLALRPVSRVEDMSARKSTAAPVDEVDMFGGAWTEQQLEECAQHVASRYPDVYMWLMRRLGGVEPKGEDVFVTKGDDAEYSRNLCIVVSREPMTEAAVAVRYNQGVHVLSPTETYTVHTALLGRSLSVEVLKKYGFQFQERRAKEGHIVVDALCASPLVPEAPKKKAPAPTQEVVSDAATDGE